MASEVNNELDLSQAPMAPEEVEKRLQKIHALEQKIILILHTASDAVTYLQQGKASISTKTSGGQPQHPWRNKFEASTKQYYALLEEVSVELRREVRLLRKMTREKVLPVQIPPRAVWQEAVKEKEIWAQIDKILEKPNNELTQSETRNIAADNESDKRDDEDVEMS